MSRIVAAVALLLAGVAAHAAPSSGEARFRDLFKELVETDTSLSNGSCTLAAERMAARLRAAGFAESDLHLFADPSHPREGGMVAVFPGRAPRTKAILLLAHLDVVEAKREDWTRDPFKLVEENGNFYARGVADDKAEAAIWVDLLIRFREEGYHPARTVKVALTCGEESAARSFNGARWLAENRRDLIDAEFAINEGGDGALDGEGRHLTHNVEAGQKTYQDFRVEVTNPGGHSSVPRDDNAIYQLAGALKRIEAYRFPVQLIDASRAYFAGMAKVQRAKGEAATADAMEALIRDPDDRAAAALISKNAGWNSMLRTTCTATMLEGGHAPNALPQRARATINCRIFPGVSRESVLAKLKELVSEPAAAVTMEAGGGPVQAPPPLPSRILEPIQSLTEQFWPGVPTMPFLLQGASDSLFLNAAGIPTYGIEPLFLGPDFGNVHGLDEYVSVKSLMDCREFLYRLVKIYADQGS